MYNWASNIAHTLHSIAQYCPFLELLMLRKTNVLLEMNLMTHSSNFLFSTLSKLCSLMGRGNLT